MGVIGLWSDFDHVPTTSIIEWSIQAWSQYKRCPRIAIDMSQLLYELVESSKEWGHSNFHRQFIRRIAAFMSCGVQVVAVFDGPLQNPKLRHDGRSYRVTNNNVISFMKKCLHAMGIPVINASGEAEAQCSYLQFTGLVDAVFSSDADVFCFGATYVVRYAKKSEIYDVQDTAMFRQIKVVDLNKELGGSYSRWSFILRALLQGNDFSAGVENLGVEYARQAAKPNTNFASDLQTLVASRSKRLQQDFRENFIRELHLNESGFYKKRKSNATFPEVFPDIETALIFAEPSIKPVTHLEYNWRLDLESLLELWRGKSPIFGKQADVSGSKRVKKSTVEQDFANTLFAPWFIGQILGKNDMLAWVNRAVEVENGLCSINFDIELQAAKATRVISIPTHILKMSRHNYLYYRGQKSIKGNTRLVDFFKPVSFDHVSISASSPHASENSTSTSMPEQSTLETSTEPETSVVLKCSEHEIIDLTDEIKPKDSCGVTASLSHNKPERSIMTAYFPTTSVAAHRTNTSRSMRNGISVRASRSESEQAVKAVELKSRPIPVLPKQTRARGSRSLPGSKASRCNSQKSISELFSKTTITL